MFPLPNVSTGAAAASAAGGTFTEYLNPAPLVSGRRIYAVPPGWLFNTSATAVVFSNANIYWSPFFVRKTGVYDRIGLYEVASGANDWKVAIYDENRNILEDLGLISTIATGGIRETTINRTFTANKLYYYAVKGNSTGASNGNFHGIIPPTLSTATAYYYKDVTQDYFDSDLSVTASFNSMMLRTTGQTYSAAMPATLPVSNSSVAGTALVYLRAA